MDELLEPRFAWRGSIPSVVVRSRAALRLTGSAARLGFTRALRTLAAPVTYSAWRARRRLSVAVLFMPSLQGFVGFGLRRRTSGFGPWL